MSSFMQDVRYALRQLRKSPGFTLTIVITLALGIGANAAVFTMFDQVLLRMLPVEKPKELVSLEWNGGFSGSMSSFGGLSPEHIGYFSYPMYRDLREQNHVFQDILAADRTQVGVSWRNQAENKDAEIVSGNYFQLLGLKPERISAPRAISSGKRFLSMATLSLSLALRRLTLIRPSADTSRACSSRSPWLSTSYRGERRSTISRIIRPSGSRWWRASSPA